MSGLFQDGKQIGENLIELGFLQTVEGDPEELRAAAQEIAGWWCEGDEEAQRTMVAGMLWSLGQHG